MPRVQEAAKPRFMQERAQEILATKESQKRVNRLRGEWEFRNIILRKQQHEASQLLKSLISPRVFDGVHPTGPQPVQVVDDDKLFVVTSVDKANAISGRLRQTTVYPEASYHINRLSFSRASRRPKVNTWQQGPAFQVHPRNVEESTRVQSFPGEAPNQSESINLDFFRVEEEEGTPASPPERSVGRPVMTGGSGRQPSSGAHSHNTGGRTPRVSSKPPSRQIHLELPGLENNERSPGSNPSEVFHRQGSSAAPRGSATPRSIVTPRSGRAAGSDRTRSFKIESSATTPRLRWREHPHVAPVPTSSHDADFESRRETAVERLPSVSERESARHPSAVPLQVHGGPDTFRREYWQTRRAPAGIWAAGGNLASLVGTIKDGDNAETYDDARGFRLHQQFRRDRGDVPSPRHGPLTSDTEGKPLSKNDLVGDWIRICDTVPVSMSKVYSELYSTHSVRQVGLQNVGPRKGGSRRWMQIVSDRGSSLQSMTGKIPGTRYPPTAAPAPETLDLATPDLPHMSVVSLVQED